jgi:hypothetical protein
MTTTEQIQKQNEAACVSVALHEKTSPLEVKCETPKCKDLVDPEIQKFCDKHGGIWLGMGNFPKDSV